MKIDNILNKEKSPDKATIAERPNSIDDLKKSQKFFDFNDLSSATNLNNNLLQDQEVIYNYLPPTTSKLKKLLLNNEPDVSHISDFHQHSGFLANNLSNSNSATTKNNNFMKSIDVGKRNINNSILKKSARSSCKKQLFQCSECNEKFLKLHLFNHIKSVHNKFTCLYCYGFFADAGELEKHLVKKHKVQNASFFDEVSLQNFLGVKLGVPTERKVKAVCCKCGCIFELIDGDFSTHSCVDDKRIIEVPVHQQPETNTNFLTAARNDLNCDDKTPTAAKENFYCDQAIQRWCQPNLSVPEQDKLHENSLPLRIHPALEPSSQVVPQENDSWRKEDKPVEEKLVPKLTLKIPKAFQHQQFSEDESMEEGSSSDDNERYESNKSGSFSQNLSKSNDRDVYSSSLSDTDNETSDKIQHETPKKTENLPSLKLKIKNLASNNPESVLENFDFLEESKLTETAKDVDLSDCPMDLEPHKDEMLQRDQEPQPEPPKLVIVDGFIITPANEDVLTLDISLDEGLDKIPIIKLMKICLKASFPFCLYCNHARKIVVNGRALATHFITNHRFHASVASITAEELHPEKFVNKFEESADELQACFFNLETFDNQDDEKKEGHVTISHDKLYECFQCRFQTSINKELYLHNRKMHTKSIVNCLMCKTLFYSFSELLCHICPGVPNKQSQLDFKFYCCLCNLDNIPSAFRLMVHLRKKHYACDVCLEKCSDQSKLSSHVCKHKLSHLCYRCNVSYRNKEDIMKHLFWKHGTEGIECKKCLKKKWPHVYHFCIPPAAFTCTNCEMSFSTAMALNVHMRLHEDGAKYPCSELECEKKFVSKKLLLRHLERHRQEASIADGENGRQEGSVVIPAVIPDGFCTRTMAVVFKRMTRRPIIRAIENENPETKLEADLKKNEEADGKVLHNLPETNLNLSESSDSDSSDDENSGPGERSIESLAALVEAQIEDAIEADPGTSDSHKPALSDLAKVSSLSDSDDDDETENKKDKNIVDGTTPVNDIEDEAKSSNEQNAKTDTVDHKEESTATAEVETASTKEVEETEDKLPENFVTHVCQSDHDYAILFGPPSGTTKDDLENFIESAKIAKQKRKIEKAAKAAQKKIKKPSNENDDFSSSDTNSGSSSSSSSGSSSSGSSSSSTSSDSSSSEASNNIEKQRIKKFSKKRTKKEKKSKVEGEEAEPPRDPDDIIYESDLVTDQTDTDEDFYDERPLNLNNEIAEKRRLLLKGGVLDGIVENSRPSTPSLPPDEKIERRIKKKRKKERRKSSNSTKRHNKVEATINPGDTSMGYFNNSLFSHQPETPQPTKFGFNYHQTSTPLSAPPRIELHQANQIRQLLQSTQQQPVLPILKEQHFFHSQLSNASADYVNVSHVPSMASSATSSRKNSDSESALKRSQRKRIPNKFYGYTSDDESMAAQLAMNPNDPFKPIPPPQFVWRKEDLPTKNKSPSNTPRIAPFKLNLAGDQLQHQLSSFAAEHKQTEPQDYNYDTTSHDPQQIPAHVPHHNISAHVNSRSNRPSDSDSSDEDQLHISEPRRRKRKLPSQANSMYAFHTLETPPTVAQPPIPRLKLTIGSNNKIRRRNINPLKAPPAKKRKLAGGNQKKNATNPAVTPLAAAFNPYAKQYDLQPPTRLLQSPSFDQSFNQDASGSRQINTQDRLEKKLKLDEAIMNTQQYFQRFNHTELASAAVPQAIADGDGREYCYCRRSYDDLHPMIACDGEGCQIEWFHNECVGILVAPKGSWYCPECQKKQMQ